MATPKPKTPGYGNVPPARAPKSSKSTPNKLPPAVKPSAARKGIGPNRAPSRGSR